MLRRYCLFGTVLNQEAPTGIPSEGHETDFTTRAWQQSRTFEFNRAHRQPVMVYIWGISLQSFRLCKGQALDSTQYISLYRPKQQLHCRLVHVPDGTASVLSSTDHTLLPWRDQDKDRGPGSEARMREPPTKLATLLTERALVAEDMGHQVTCCLALLPLRLVLHDAPAAPTRPVKCLATTLFWQQWK